jgi:prevent-host-death family protein
MSHRDDDSAARAAIPTSSVGIRALQQHVSAVVARAAGGERIVVTDRGRPAALLIPIPGAGLQRLVTAGLARAARFPASEIAPPAAARPGDRPLSESLAQVRADQRD